jgi:hypothetical protein
LHRRWGGTLPCKIGIRGLLTKVDNASIGSTRPGYPVGDDERQKKKTETAAEEKLPTEYDNHNPCRQEKEPQREAIGPFVMYCHFQLPFDEFYGFADSQKVNLATPCDTPDRANCYGKA